MVSIYLVYLFLSVYFDFTVSLYFKYVSCNQHTPSFFWRIYSYNLYLLIGKFIFILHNGIFRLLKNIFLSFIFPVFFCFLYFYISFLSWDGGLSVLSLFWILHSFFFLTSFIKLPFHFYSFNSNRWNFTILTNKLWSPSVF